MGLVIKKPGVSTTVQDLGRTGYLGSGFSPNGVMDHRAAIIANILVENPRNASVLEFVLAGPTIRFTNDTYIALTGAEFEASINNAPVPRYRAIRVSRGSILRMRGTKDGMYGYLAVAGGGLDVPEVMGSRSTNLRCNLGGFHGRALRYGDYISYMSRVEFLANLKSHAIDDSAYYEHEEDGSVLIRVVPGPQDDLFTQEGIDTFYSSEFVTTSSSDRMGYRLDGPEIATKHGSDIISDGIPFGAVQIPSEGRPIVMLADRQTTGGYAKIGVLASVDIPKLVQQPAGRKVRFAPISVQEAQQLLRLQRGHYRSLEHLVRRPSMDDVSQRRAARRLTPILEAQAEKTKGEPIWLMEQKGVTHG